MPKSHSPQNMLLMWWKVCHYVDAKKRGGHRHATPALLPACIDCHFQGLTAQQQSHIPEPVLVMLTQTKNPTLFCTKFSTEQKFSSGSKQKQTTQDINAYYHPISSMRKTQMPIPTESTVLLLTSRLNDDFLRL